MDNEFFEDVDKAAEKAWEEWGEPMGLSLRDFGMIFEGGWMAAMSTLQEGV